MWKAIFVFATALVIVPSTKGQQTILCTIDKVYNSCGTKCPITCQNPHPRPCPKICVKGCFCPQGKILDESTNICVDPKNCSKCPPGETFNSCGSACPQTCNTCAGRSCTLQCVKGCFCNKGTIRDEITNKCVPPKDCTTCPEGEVYNSCGPGCPPSCKVRDGRLCKVKDCIPGCYCAEGLLRDEATGKCVYPYQCQTCPDGETYTPCGAYCAPTCSNPNPKFCPKICIPGCLCPKGLVRHNDGRCVAVSECKKCPEGEVYSECGAFCQAHCSQIQSRPVACPEICMPGCVCPKGQYRNTDGQCVTADQCHQCPKNQEYHSCGSACPATCKEPKPGPCILVCKAGCFCKEGLYWDDEIKDCVPIEECPQTEPPCKGVEVFKPCGSSCLKTCSNPDPGCTKECHRGCFCPEGYVRDENNHYECIPLEKCPKVINHTIMK